MAPLLVRPDDGRVRDASLHELARLLRRPGAVPPADGLPVTVGSVGSARHGAEVVIGFSVPGLPDGVCRQPAPRDSDLSTYASEVAEELQAWATEHVRKHRPLPPPDRERVRRELPSREELWGALREEFSGVRDEPGGFVGTNRFGVELRVMLTPEAWQEYVVDSEIACRNDYGVDADGPGDGPMVALGDLDETMATMRDDELFLVLHRQDLQGSTRAQLPPVRGVGELA